MGSSGLIAALAVGVWLVWALVSAAKVLRRLEVRPQDAWGPCLRWGMITGALLSLAIVTPFLWEFLSGEAPEDPVLIFALVGPLSGPGFAHYLLREHNRRKRSARDASAGPL